MHQKKLKIMSKVRPHLTTEACLRIYNMFVMPTLTYCSQLHAYLTRTQINRLLSIQNRARDIIGPTNKLLRNPETCIHVNNCLFVRKCVDKNCRR